jgi:two-component system, OmpR family, sensor kinase
VKINLPLRWRLTFWYSIIVLVSLNAFAAFAYNWVSNELYTNLDESLIKISSTLNHIIEESSKDEPINQSNKNEFAELLMKSADKFAVFKNEAKSRFIGPLLPELNKSSKDKGDIVWSAIFKHLLLNPENYFIQIADTDHKIIWKSRNLSYYDLPVDSSTLKKAVKEKISGQSKLLFDDINIKNTDLRLLVNHSSNAVISIAYTVEDVTDTLRSLFSALLLAVPLILLASISSGMFLSKMSLRTVDEITKTAKEIKAKNLSLRLDVPKTNDEISRLAETLNEMIERLEESFAQIRQFTSDASHELRTPLTILRGEMEIALNKNRSNEEYISVITSALEEVIRLSNVVESLLELSRADAGQSRLILKTENISRLLTDIVEDMEIIAEDKDIKLKSEIQKKLFCEFDSARMHQALLNIIDNAVKYTNNGGRVTVKLNESAQWVEIKIADNGVGMAQEALAHIFDRFYRVDISRGADHKGSGLGLSIVKWIIEAHKGKIFVESQPNRGTNFIVLLPKKHDENKAIL